jgi:hypothetical protein
VPEWPGSVSNPFVVDFIIFVGEADQFRAGNQESPMGTLSMEDNSKWLPINQPSA